MCRQFQRLLRVIFSMDKYQGYSFRFFKYVNVILVLLFTNAFSVAQNSGQQLEFIVANDKFADQDKYFTSGLYLSYQKLLNNKFILPKTADNKLQLNLTIGNETYSPASISSFDTKDFDRPFAGWLFGKLEVGALKKKSALFMAFETGITGKPSLAGALQVGLHELFRIDSRPTWVEEIEFKWLFNLKLTHVTNWQLNERHALQYSISPSLGTKDIYLENNIAYYFGRLNSFQNSARIRAVDATITNEFFGYFSAGYKYVAHNTLIQGGLFKDDLLFTTDVTRHVLNAEVGAVLKSKRNTFRAAYNFNTRETRLATSHIYGYLGYVRSF